MPRSGTNNVKLVIVHAISQLKTNYNAISAVNLFTVNTRKLNHAFLPFLFDGLHSATP